MPDLTQAATPLHLGGVEYRLSPCTDEDIEELDNWLRSSVIRMAHDSLTEGMSQAERREILDVAMDKARELSWVSGDGAKAMASLDGISRVVWQGLRHNHPELTHADVRKLIVDKRTIEYAMNVWRMLNLEPATGKAKGGDPRERRGPKVSRQPRKRR